MILSPNYFLALVFVALFSYWTYRDKALSNTIFLWAVFLGVMINIGMSEAKITIISLVISFIIAVICFIFVPSGGFKSIIIIGVYLPCYIPDTGIPLYLSIIVSSLSLLYIVYYLTTKKLYIPYFTGRAGNDDYFINIPFPFFVNLLLFSVFPTVSEVNIKLSQKFSIFAASTSLDAFILKTLIFISLFIPIYYKEIDNKIERYLSGK